MRRIRSNVRPDKSNKDAFSIQHVLGIKLAASILELADLGYDHGAILAVGPIEFPLAGLRVIQTQSQTFDVAGRPINLDRVQLSAALPNLVADTCAIKFDPGVGAG